MEFRKCLGRGHLNLFQLSGAPLYTALTGAMKFFNFFSVKGKNLHYFQPISTDMLSCDSGMSESKIRFRHPWWLVEIKYCAWFQWLMCGSCHILNVLISVEYWKSCWTLDVCLLSATWMGPIQSRLIYIFVLILASTNPQYDKRLSSELPFQYMKIPSSEHGENMGRTCCLHELF